MSGKAFSLKDLRGKFTLIYFYPKDDTPGCTIEAKGFNSALSKFAKLKTKVVGISGGDEKSKTKFCKKYGLKFTLLSDPEFKVAKAFGSFGPKVFMGRKYQGIFRNTYLLNEKQEVVKVFESVKPDTHPEEVLAFIATFGKENLRAEKQNERTSKPKNTERKSVAKKVVSKKSSSSGKSVASQKPRKGSGMRKKKVARASSKRASA